MVYNDSMPSDKILNLKDYQELPPTVTFASKMLAQTWEILGKPEDPLSEAGSKLMYAVIAVWEELYSDDAKKWAEDRKDYKKAELSTREQVAHHTGRSLASYPFPIFQMMKKLFPKFKATERQNCMKMVARFPMFLMANRA